MTIIRPNSISGINSITAKNTDQMKLYDSNGSWSHVRAGVVTATSFSGPITGSTGTFGGDVTISGNLGVAGTVTYEDVARVDATGISTFREGFHLGPLSGVGLTAYKDGSIRSTGIITATKFIGDGSELTGAGPTLANGSNDRVVTATGANALNGESNLTFSGSTLGVTGDALISNSGGNAKLKIKRSNTASNTDDYGSILFQSSANNNNVSIGAARESAENDAYLFFSTASGGSLAERLRITKDGKFGFNTTDTSGNQRVTIKQTSHDTPLFLLTDQSNCYMGLGNSAATNGYIGFESTTLTFHNNGKKAEIDTSGNLKLNAGNLVIGTSGKGIDFAVTSDATGKSNELLDDYEEGSWTPSMDGLSNTPSFYNLVGKYTKIGNIVKCQGFIQIGATKPTFSNDNNVFKISGLPFAMSGVGYNGVIGNVMWQQINWVGASRSTYGHNDDTQITAAISGGTKTEFATCGQGKYYMGRLFNKVFGEGDGWILEWDFTYYT